MGQHVRILGIDPGSRLTGYGCIDVIGNQIRLVTHGTLRLSNTGGKSVVPLERRLLSIYEGLTKVIEQHRPQVMAIEKVFFAKNAVSALKLGQARGAAILSGAIHSLTIFEYSPTEVKASLAGHGQADKTQIARVLQMILGAQQFDTPDASDGLAIALCHAYRMAGRSPLHKILEEHGATPKKKRNLSLAESVGFAANLSKEKRR